MAFNPDKHEKVIKNTLADIKAGVFDDLKALENQIAELVASGAAPQTIRPQLVQAFNASKLAVENSVKPVSDLANDTLEQSSLPVTSDDDAANTALTDQTAKTVGANLDSAVENIMETIVIGSAAGLATQVVVNQVRGRISGIFMESSDPVVRRTQRKLNKLVNTGKATPDEVRDATRVIRDRLTGINTTASVRDLTAKSVQDTVMKFDAAFTSGRAERAGIEKFEYAGGVMGTSRPFCRQLTGETFTKDEIYEIWDSEDWAGKEQGDPFIVRGGYNCTHFFVPIEED